MADIKISQLGSAIAVDDSDIVPVVSGGNTLKATAAQLKEHAIGNTSISGIGNGSVTGAISALNSDKQPKTLATSITVDGTPQTTVEGALGAINTDLGSTKQALTTNVWQLKDSNTITATSSAHANLNTYTTVGNYTCTMNAASEYVDNQPIASNRQAFNLIVMRILNSNDSVKQILLYYNTSEIWVRQTSNGGSSWSDWECTPSIKNVTTGINGVYAKKAGKIVEIISIGTDNLTNNTGWTRIGTLPTSIKPTDTQYFMGFDNNATNISQSSVVMRIDTSGEMFAYLFSGNTASVSVRFSITYFTSNY